MGTNVFTSAGTTLGLVADAPATEDEAGYSALTFVSVGEITDLGEFGREYSEVTHNPLGERRTQKLKGSFNDGSITLQMGRVPSDAGQALIQTALDDDADYSFEVTLQDGTVQYFQAKVMSYTTNNHFIEPK